MIINYLITLVYLISYFLIIIFQSFDILFAIYCYTYLLLFMKIHEKYIDKHNNLVIAKNIEEFIKEYIIVFIKLQLYK